MKKKMIQFTRTSWILAVIGAIVAFSCSASLQTSPLSPTIGRYNTSAIQAAGFSGADITALKSASPEEAEAAIAANLLQQIDAAEWERDFSAADEASEIRETQEMLLSDRIAPEEKEALMLKTEYYLEAQELSESEQEDHWLEYTAKVSGFDSVEAYLAWEAEWMAYVNSQMETEEEYQQRIALEDQAKKESNGGYMGCAPGGP